MDSAYCADSATLYEILPAVAVLVDGGFLCETAPLARRKGKHGGYSLLLTHAQRREMDDHGLAPYEQVRYQGQYEDSLPNGYKDPALRERALGGWTNAENQWYEAAALLRFLERASKSDASYSAVMLLTLVEAAANGGKAPVVDHLTGPSLARALLGQITVPAGVQAQPAWRWPVQLRANGLAQAFDAAAHPEQRGWLLYAATWALDGSRQYVAQMRCYHLHSAGLTYAGAEPISLIEKAEWERVHGLTPSPGEKGLGPNPFGDARTEVAQ